MGRQLENPDAWRKWSQLMDESRDLGHWVASCLRAARREPHRALSLNAEAGRLAEESDRLADEARAIYERYCEYGEVW